MQNNKNMFFSKKKLLVNKFCSTTYYSLHAVLYKWNEYTSSNSAFNVLNRRRNSSAKLRPSCTSIESDTGRFAGWLHRRLCPRTSTQINMWRWYNNSIIMCLQLRHTVQIIHSVPSQWPKALANKACNTCQRELHQCFWNIVDNRQALPDF